MTPFSRAALGRLLTLVVTAILLAPVVVGASDPPWYRDPPWYEDLEYLTWDCEPAGEECGETYGCDNEAGSTWSEQLTNMIATLVQRGKQSLGLNRDAAKVEEPVMIAQRHEDATAPRRSATVVR